MDRWHLSSGLRKTFGPIREARGPGASQDNHVRFNSNELIQFIRPSSDSAAGHWNVRARCFPGLSRLEVWRSDVSVWMRSVTFSSSGNRYLNFGLPWNRSATNQFSASANQYRSFRTSS